MSWAIRGDASGKQPTGAEHISTMHKMTAGLLNQFAR
jgi:hypothetical protein